MKVTVTFMRMTRPLKLPAHNLPLGWRLEQIEPTLAYYRGLQDRVGRDYCWWMRQASSDADLTAFLESKTAEIGLLMQGDTPRGFYELDLSDKKQINLAYFGLFPDTIGQGVGRAFLESVVARAWSFGPLELLVNTCTADHPRALSFYKDVGFTPVRAVDEVWDVPQRLGLVIPERFRV